MNMDKIKYNNDKLCRRNFKFIDKLLDNMFDYLVLGLVGLIIIGIWFNYPIFVTKLIWSDVFLIIFTVIFVRIKYLHIVNGEFKYYDEYSEVVEPPKTIETELLTEEN